MAEASPAGGARIGLLPGVDQHVRAQMRYLGEEGTSDSANGRDRTLPIRPTSPSRKFACEPSLKLAPYLYKARAARLTLVGLLSRMDAAMRFQVSRPVKAGSADGAVVGLFPWRQGGREVSDSTRGRLWAPRPGPSPCSSPTCVHRAVTGQVALIAEGRPAELTLVGLILIPRSQGVQPR